VSRLGAGDGAQQYRFALITRVDCRDDLSLRQGWSNGAGLWRVAAPILTVNPRFWLESGAQPRTASGFFAQLIDDFQNICYSEAFSNKWRGAPVEGGVDG
jgi:hypothetical protein